METELRVNEQKVNIENPRTHLPNQPPQHPLRAATDLEVNTLSTKVFIKERYILTITLNVKFNSSSP